MRRHPACVLVDLRTRAAPAQDVGALRLGDSARVVVQVREGDGTETEQTAWVEIVGRTTQGWIARQERGPSSLRIRELGQVVLEPRHIAEVRTASTMRTLDRPMTTRRERALH
jgi:hypothetical protein